MASEKQEKTIELTASRGRSDTSKSADGSEPGSDDAHDHRRRQSLKAGPSAHHDLEEAEAPEEPEDEYDTALGRLASVTRTRSRSNSALPPPPDGGLQAWLQVFAGWLVLFCTWGWLNSFGAFQSYYTETALPNVAPSAISWIGSLQACLTTAFGIFTGRLLDAGFFRPTFAVGAVIQLAGLFAMSAYTNPPYWHLMLTQGVLTGLGAGILFTPSIGLIATWFSNNRGLALGIVTTGNSTGGIVYPLIVRELIPKIGFVWTARVLGFVNLTCFGTAFIILRPRLPPRKSGPVVEWAAFKEGVFVTYVAALFLFTWANYYLFYYIASWGIARLGMSYSAASVLVMIVNGCGIPARIAVPMLADRIGPLNMMLMSMTALAIVITCWFGVVNFTGFYAFTAVVGVVSGAVQSLMPTTVASITKRLDTVGTRLGMAFGVASLGSLTGPPIGGAIQSGGGFEAAQAWAAVAGFAAAGLLVLGRWCRVGWKLKAIC